MEQNKLLPSTQAHLDIEDIRDDMLVLKNGNVVSVLQTNAVNFDLLSEAEQDAMIFAYSQLLNSLTFPIQVIIRSKIMDISNYLAKLQEAKQITANKPLAAQIELYELFIKELVAKNNVLDKRFYIVIPFIEVSLSSVNPLSVLSSNKKVVFDKWATLERAKVSLQPKKDHLIKQLSRIGIKTKQLSTQELVELFYDVYNPSVAREQKVALTASDYTTSVVEPAIETTFVTTPERSVNKPLVQPETPNPQTAAWSNPKLAASTSSQSTPPNTVSNNQAPTPIAPQTVNTAPNPSPAATKPNTQPLVPTQPNPSQGVR